MTESSFAARRHSAAAPDYSTPDYSTPDYSAPDYSTPGHSAPGHSAPGHSADGQPTGRVTQSGSARYAPTSASTTASSAQPRGRVPGHLFGIRARPSLD